MSSRDLSVVATEEAPTPISSYSQGRIIDGFLFTAGMGPHDPKTEQVVGPTITEQTEQTLQNLQAVLTAAGATRGDIVKATVHLDDLERDFAGFNEAYSQFVRPPYPVRTTVGSRLLGILVEIDIVAKLP